MNVFLDLPVPNTNYSHRPIHLFNPFFFVARLAAFFMDVGTVTGI